MTEVTDEDLFKETSKMLKKADLSDITMKVICEKLENKFNIKLDKNRRKILDRKLKKFLNDKDDVKSTDKAKKSKLPEAAQPKPSKKRRKASSDDDSDYEPADPFEALHSGHIKIPKNKSVTVYLDKDEVEARKLFLKGKRGKPSRRSKRIH